MTRGALFFWVFVTALIAVDYAASGHPRLEPPPFALGSGQAWVGGHCSGR